MGEFLEDDFWVNRTLKIDYQKRFPVIPMYSMCQLAIFLSRLSTERELGIIAG